MATILEFRPRKDDVRGPVRRKSRGQLAEIVLFPGIRYERWADPNEGAAAAPRASRDILKLCD